MASLINISLMIYFTLVAIIGTLGNGVILLAYGNRWNSSKSTSVIFILILACVDLWTCLIVVPAIAIMEYRDFDVPTPICRFYSFSKNLIIISSFIMSFIALDRFLNIALPHCQLLNPRRVKVLLTLFIAIGIGLGTLTALAFSTQPIRKNYFANYDLIFTNETLLTMNKEEIGLDPNDSPALSPDTISIVTGQLSIPDGANVSNLTLAYKSTSERCFADTSIISETLRDLLKHVSNKAFFTLIGIVTIFYTITFLLALRRQNPRIRALKKSLNVLNKFDSKPLSQSNRQTTSSIVLLQNQQNSSIAIATATTTSTKVSGNILNDLNLLDKLVSEHEPNKKFTNINEKQYEMSNLNDDNDSDDQSIPSTPVLRKSTKAKKKLQQQQEHPDMSSSDGTSDELPTSTERVANTKQVSFQIESNQNALIKEPNQNISLSSNSSNGALITNTDMCYKLPFPCSTTRQLLIKFHFARPSSQIGKCLCCCRRKNQPQINHHSSMESQTEEETVKSLVSSNQNNRPSHSDTLRRQLHQHRLKQIRMASTFLIITVSFVLFYLPSILNAERIIKSPIMIYYLYLCTHALNPIIYCFMNPSLRAYVISMCTCFKKQRDRYKNRGRSSFFDR